MFAVADLLSSRFLAMPKDGAVPSTWCEDEQCFFCGGACCCAEGRAAFHVQRGTL